MTRRPKLVRDPRLALVLRRLLAGLLATTWLWAIDRLAARILNEGAAPLGWGATWSLWGGHALALCAVGIAAAALAGALWIVDRVRTARSQLPKEGRGRDTALWGGTIAGVMVSYPASLLAQELVAGEGVRDSGWAAVVRLGLVASMVLLTAGLCWWIYLPATRQPGRARWLLVAAMVGASAGASLLDVMVLPGLYPEAHLTLYLASALFIAIAMSRALDEAGLPPAWPAAAAVLLLCAGVVSWWRMSAADRAMVSQASPVAQMVIPHILPAVPDDNLRRILEGLDVHAARLEEAAVGGDARHADAAPSGGDTGLSVLLLVVDTMRVDAIFRRPGGVGRDGDTPHLDAWLSGAHRFHHAYAPASKTVTSLPPTFHSCEPHEDPDAVGQPLGVRMSELGLAGAAVVPQYFLMPVKGSRESLLAGFRHSAFVRKDRQSELPALVDETFSRLEGEPFLGWIHFYSLHAPYYTDRLTSSADGSARERYRAALRHLDDTLHQVMVGLEQRGQLDDTIVVLLSDHGENLGDNRRSGHGSTVLEEVVRVPLAIRIPGTEGGDIEQTVGTIDLVPTLLELVGAPADPTLRGVSLVPLLHDRGAPWSRSYMVSSGRKKVQGVVTGRDKLFLERRTGLFYRFDLATDPTETRNLFADGPADRTLIEALYHHNPELAAAQLDEPRVRELLLRRLQEIDPDAPPASLPLLLGLVVLRPEPEAVDAVEGLLRQTSSPRARLLAAASLAVVAPPRAAEPLADHLATLSDQDAAGFVEALARQRQPPFAVELVRERMRALAEDGEPEDWLPWLQLTAPWPKRHRAWVSPLVAMMRREPPPVVLLPLLRNVTSLIELPSYVAPSVPLIAPMLQHARGDHPEVARAAIEALAHIGPKAALPLLQQMAAEPEGPPRVRQAVLHALLRLQGVDAVNAIISLGADPLLVVDAIEALRQIGDRAALPFLERVRDQHYNRFTRRRAELAIDAIVESTRAE